MDALQRATISPANPAVVTQKTNKGELTNVQQTFIDYKALGGLIIDDETGEVRKMTVSQLAAQMGVKRDAFYKAKAELPDFWDRVNARRREISKGARLSRIHDKFYLKALQMDNWPLTEAWLANFDDNYKRPGQKVEEEQTNNWSELMAKRRDRDSTKIVEAEVISDATNQPG